MGRDDPYRAKKVTKPIRQAPPDFLEIGPTLTITDCQRHWGVSERVAQRWYRTAGIRPAKYIPTGHKIDDPVPEGFAADARRMCPRDLQRKYHRGRLKVILWLSECGIEPTPRDQSAIMRRYWQARPPAPKKRPPPVIRPQHVWKPIPGPDGSLHGQAAQFMRQYAAVYRARESGRADQQGEFYRYGNVILTPDELLQRAEAKGWRFAA